MVALHLSSTTNRLTPASDHHNCASSKHAGWGPGLHAPAHTSKKSFVADSEANRDLIFTPRRLRPRSRFLTVRTYSCLKAIPSRKWAEVYVPALGTLAAPELEPGRLCTGGRVGDAYRRLALARNKGRGINNAYAVVHGSAVGGRAVGPSVGAGGGAAAGDAGRWQRPPWPPQGWPTRSTPTSWLH